MGRDAGGPVTDYALLTTRQMARADALTIARGIAGATLMETAGAAVFAVADRMCALRAHVLILAGPGNNGGDGFVAARLLAESGRTVTVALMGERAALRGDAALAAARWTGPVMPLLDADPAAADLIVDAVFGAGLAREIAGELAALFARINQTGIPVLAVDVPSGVDGDSGAVRGTAIRATETVTFFRKKPGHLLMPGRALCGPVTVADIGIADDVLAATGVAGHENSPDLWRSDFPVLDVNGHKYHRGHGLVVAGGLEGVGAPRLSARAALRMGAGLVTIAAEPDALAAHAARGPDALMLRACADMAALENLLADRRRNVCIIGPALGLTQGARAKVRAVLRSAAACVLDADALTLLSGHGAALARTAAAKPVVITPHEGEFARLFNDFPGNAARLNPAADHSKPENAANALKSESKLVRAQAAAGLSRAVVVLKGADTVIAAPDGRAAINANAPAWLGTAGAGDVLSGLIGGLLAQGMETFEAACAAVWIHGDTAAHRSRGMIADDLIEYLRWPDL